MSDDLAARTRQARKARKMTQRAVADAAGISLRAYQMFETRQATPQPENLRAILSAVGIDEVEDEVAAATREGWPPEVQVFLDMLGAYLMTREDADRLDLIHDLTRQIFENHRQPR